MVHKLDVIVLLESHKVLKPKLADNPYGLLKIWFGAQSGEVEHLLQKHNMGTRELLIKVLHN